MSTKKKVYEVGDLVFAKVRGYPAWPARISNKIDEKGSKYHVFFYGTYEVATVKREEIWPFNEDTKAKFGKQKRKGFAEGLYEIENTPDIASESVEPEGRLQIAVPEDTSTLSAAETTTEGESMLVDTSVSTPQTPVSTKVSKVKGGAKRKAEESPATTPMQPAAKLAKTAATPASTPAAETPENKTTSRSGRVIKPKKFDDDVAETPKRDESATPTPTKTPVPKAVPKKKEEKEPRKMWVQVKATGDMIEINLDKDRPAKFESKEAEIQWEKNTVRNALKFKEKVESGEFIPEEIRKKLEAKVNRTPEEEEILKKERTLMNRKEKIKWLKIEQHLVDLDIAIKTALHIRNPDVDKCLEALNELNVMSIAPLMLKKQPDIVNTIRKCRKYIGPEEADEKKAKALFNKTETVRSMANQIFMKLKSLFAVPEDVDFWDVFETQVVDFRNYTKDMDKTKVLNLVSDPTKAAGKGKVKSK